MFWLYEWLLIMKKLYSGITDVMARTGIYIIILVLALPFINAVDCTSLNTSLTAYFSYDVNANDEKGSITGTAVNAVNGATKCKQGNCYYFDGSGDYIDYNNILNYYGGYSFSISVWVYADYTDVVGCIFCKDDTDQDPMMQFRKGSSPNPDPNPYIYLGNGGTNLFYGSYTGNMENATSHLVYIINYTAPNTCGEVYLNGTWLGKRCKNAIIDTSTIQDLRVGGDTSSGAYDFKGYIDELAVFNGTALSSSQVLQLYNNGAYCNPMLASGGGTAPSLTLNSDLKNGTVTNATYYNFFFNGSSTNNSNFYNCDIFAGITNKGSGINLNLTKNNNFSFSLPNTEQYINFTLNCYNENASKNTSALYYIDNIKTVLDWLSPNGTYYNNVQLYTNFSISDDNLYFFEYTVYQGVTLKENITHSNLHGINNYSVYNLSGVSQIVGSYAWNLKVWENHNPLSDLSLFKEYSTKINNSKITYSYNNKEYSIYSNEKMFIISQTKDYKQYFNFLIGKNDTPKTEYTYYLEYDGELIYISDSKYKGHFVLWDIKRYVDFQCKDYVKVIMINKNKYQINTPCTNFETTGNLNFMSWSGNFTITTPPSLSDAYLSSINETLYNSYIIQNNIWGEIKMFSLILINIVFIGICVWFAKNFHKRAILLVLSPLVNLIVIFMDYFNIESTRLSNTGIQIIATGMFIVSILILGLIYVLIPAKEMKKQQADVYSELVYNQK